MQRYTEHAPKGKPASDQQGQLPSAYVGIDLHTSSWHVTIQTQTHELFSNAIPGKWEALRSLLDRYRGTYQLHAVYEAGYFGYSLYDQMVAYGVNCIVTPPSLIPQQSGNRVKTDPRDSRKLAHFLAMGDLKGVWVPSAEQRAHRSVIRRRQQLISDRVRVQNRIKAELRFYGLALPMERHGAWSKSYRKNLHSLEFGDRWIQESFARLLDELEFLTTQIVQQTKLVAELAVSDTYREQVAIVRSIPGFGVISTMELLLELQDIGRFRRSKQLAAYVGLTPSQHTSGPHVRMGRITAIGKNHLRGTLIEVAWRAMAKDPPLRQKFDQLKHRTGVKRAIVAIARIVLIRTRRLLLDHREYVPGLVVQHPA